MKTSDAMRLFDDHQQRILGHLDTALALTRQPPAEARQALAVARWTTVRLLQAHQIFKHTEIFDPAIRSGSPAQAQAASRLKVDCIAAGEAFRDYVRKWSTTNAEEQWDRYQPAMLAMAEQMCAHLRSEREAVAALLDGAERTRRLAADCPPGGTRTAGAAPPARLGAAA